MLNIFDYSIITYIVLYTIFNLRKKLLFNIYSFIKNLLSFLIAFTASIKIIPFITNKTGIVSEYANIIVFISIFITLYLVFTFGIFLLKMLAEISFTAIIEKPLNLILGIFSGTILTIVIMYSITILPTKTNIPLILKDSYFINTIKELKPNEDNENVKGLTFSDYIKKVQISLNNLITLNNNK